LQLQQGTVKDRPVPHSATVNQPILMPDDPGMLAWRTFLTAHATVIRRLDAELEERESLALSDFDVLAQLHFAGGTLRMRDLADSVLLSRSGMTRRVDRLEAAGFVTREACETDRRGSMASLTVQGRDRLLRALPVHIQGISDHFLALLGEDELDSLKTTLAKLVPPDRRPA
jgi:DNA-binding MarR family transcriptional regulator